MGRVALPVERLPYPDVAAASILLQVQPRLHARQAGVPGEVQGVRHLLEVDLIVSCSLDREYQASS